MNAKDVNIKNRRARFDYEISETFVAGIVLTGTEIKSIRDGKASLVDTYCLVENGEVWVKGMNTSEYYGCSPTSADWPRCRLAWAAVRNSTTSASPSANARTRGR